MAFTRSCGDFERYSANSPERNSNFNICRKGLGLIVHLGNVEHAVKAQLVLLELRHIAEAKVNRIGALVLLDRGATMHHRRILAALQDLKVMDHRRDEPLPALGGQELRRPAGARVDHGQRAFVFAPANRERAMRRFHHRARDLACLLHDFDFQR